MAEPVDFGEAILAIYDKPFREQAKLIVNSLIFRYGDGVVEKERMLKWIDEAPIRSVIDALIDPGGA